MITRRAIVRSLAGAGTAALFAPMFNLGRYRLLGQSEPVYSARAIELMGRSLVIDMLSPLSLSVTRSRELMANPDRFGATDIQRFRESGINVIHMASGVGGLDAHANVLAFVAGWNGFVANHDEVLMRIDSRADLDRVKRSGKIGVLIGVQNSEHFRRVEDVNLFHGLGQRVSQLTYNSRNMIGNGSTERRDGGLSDFGVAVVERMNAVGMAVDVSHSGDQTTLDAIEASRKPVLFTHSNCRALNPGHPRCKTDEAIRKMAASGGVMGITAVRMFVKPDEPTTIEHVLDHFDHVARLVGVEHVGVGSDIDLDGYDDMAPDENAQLRASFKSSYGFRERIDIEGLDHPKRMFDLTEGLIRRKYSDRDIESVLGGNFRRALVANWE
jgi:membrane dipeptidase